MWITMNAIGKSIRTGRYTDSFTQPVCAGTERQNALPWAGFQLSIIPWLGQMWYFVLLLCLADFILFWAFDISMYYLIVSVVHHGEQDSPNSTLRVAGEKGLEGDCSGNHCGGHRGDRPWKCSLSARWHLTLLRLFERQWQAPWMLQLRWRVATWT